jgi:hypothetical protein
VFLLYNMICNKSMGLIKLNVTTQPLDEAAKLKQ